MDDLNQALSLDPSRGDALVLRASVWRRMDMLDEARTDIDKALTIDPDDAEALLERGILRQRRAIWRARARTGTRARAVDPEQRRGGAGGAEPDAARLRTGEAVTPGSVMGKASSSALNPDGALPLDPAKGGGSWNR